MKERWIEITWRDPFYTGWKVSSEGNFINPQGRKHKGYKGTSGYLHIDGTQVNKKQNRSLAHRLIAECFCKKRKGSNYVDHINGNKLDNRASNLRWVTASENNISFRRKSKNCTSKYRGVSYRKADKKWVAFVKLNGKSKSLGLFKIEKEAAIAWNNAAIKLGYNKEALNNIDKD